MERIAFSDEEKIGMIGEHGTVFYESEAIARYREYEETRSRSDAWKVSGDGAKFRGDGEAAPEPQADAYIGGVAWQDGKIVYCYSVGGTSGVCRKPTDPKAREEHIFSSADREILSVHTMGQLIAVTVRADDVTAQVGVLDAKTSELSTYTEGDARDANAVFDTARPSCLLFDSAGAGRMADGSFSGKYAPAVICRLDRETLALEEVKRDAKHSCIKPQTDASGALYYIVRPEKEHRGGLFLDIVLFPFRILKALFGFLQAFTVIFGKTSLITDTGSGDNPPRGRKQDPRKLFVEGRLIDVAKEEKRNKKRKDRAYGFIPASWKLVKQGQTEEVIARGVCDYCIGKEGIYYTDGRHIYKFSAGKEEKLADTKCCLSVSVENYEEDF